MKKYYFIICLIFSLTILFSSCQPKVDIENEKADILKYFDKTITAAMEEDLSLLESLTHDTTFYIYNGTIQKFSKEEDLANFREQFNKTDFNSIIKLVEPVIRLSPDGKMAWMTGKLKIEYSFVQEDGMIIENEFEDAFLMVLEKSEDGWETVAKAETFPKNE